MRLLLDTCVLIWLSQEPAKLSAVAAAAIDGPGNTLWLSHASAWEIHLKHQAGKLVLPEPPRAWIWQQLAVWKINEKPITMNAIHRTSNLSGYHRDPFDRMLIAQAIEDEMTIVSPDKYFPAYDVNVIW